MKVSELKTIVDALSRFASIRESKNEGPEQRIGIQLGASKLKFIAGDGTSGIVVATDFGEGQFAFYVEARTFFQGVKALPAKTECNLRVDSTGLTIETSKGGSFLVPNRGSLAQAGFAPKPKGVDAAHFVADSKALNQVAKLFPAVTRGEEKLSRIVATLHLGEDGMHWTFVEPRVKTKYASLHMESTYTGQRVIIMDSGFVESLKVVNGDCDIAIGDKSVVVTSRDITIYTSAIDLEHWPVLAVQGSLHSFDIDRKQFIDILKGQAPKDEHARVVLSWEKNMLEVRPYGDDGNHKVPVTTTGHGTRAASATLLIDMLNGMDDAKVVSVCIAEGAPAIILRAKEYESWTLMLAPVVL